MEPNREAAIRIVKCPELKILDFNHGCSIFLLPEQASWIKTSVTGRWIYERLAERPTGLEQLVRDVAAHYGLSEARVAEPVRALVNELCVKGLAARGPGSARTSQTISLDDLILQQVWLNLTTACNLQCAYCYVPETGLAGRHMDLDLARKVIDQAAHMGVVQIVLSGGEPTLHPHLGEIVEHAARKPTLQLKLVTNGARTSRDYYARLFPAVQDLQVSLDGVDEATHDALRGPGSYARIVELFRMVREHYPGVTRGISFTPVPENVEQLPRLFKTAVMLGASYIHVNRPKLSARPGTGRYHDRVDFVGPAFFRRALAGFDELLANILKDRELNQGFDGRTLPRLDISFDPASELFSRVRKPRCAAGILTMCVDQDGECFPCSALCRPACSIGNVRRNRLATVYARARRRFERGFAVERDPVCGECDFRYFCGGGCRANNDDLWSRDESCDLLRERYLAVLANVPNPRRYRPAAAEAAESGAAATSGQAVCG